MHAASPSLEASGRAAREERAANKNHPRLPGKFTRNSPDSPSPALTITARRNERKVMPTSWSPCRASDMPSRRHHSRGVGASRTEECESPRRKKPGQERPRRSTRIKENVAAEKPRGSGPPEH